MHAIHIYRSPHLPQRSRPLYCQQSTVRVSAIAPQPSLCRVYAGQPIEAYLGYPDILRVSIPELEAAMQARWQAEQDRCERKEGTSDSAAQRTRPWETGKHQGTHERRD